MHQQMKCRDPTNAFLDCYVAAIDPPIEIFLTTDPYDSTFTTMPHLDIATRPPPPLSGMMKPSGELHIYNIYYKPAKNAASRNQVIVATKTNGQISLSTILIYYLASSIQDVIILILARTTT